MKTDPVNAIVLILVAAFAVDRIATGLLFLLSFLKPWARRFPDPALIESSVDKVKAEKKQRLVYFAIAGILGIVVLAGFANIRLLAALGVVPKPSVPPSPSDGSLHAFLDIVITGLVLMGAADRVARLLKLPGTPGLEPAEPRPLEITGKLTLEDGKGSRIGSVERVESRADDHVTT
jgi:hypothetical protein